jgi:protein MpaA
MRLTALAIAGSLLLASGGSAIAAPAQANFEKRIIGKSVEGRDIEAYNRGTKGGTVVLVIGVIHGDEDAGLDIVDVLFSAEIPTGVDLWLVPSMNPDGVANDTRKNANGVDLNRNFPFRWGKIGKPDYWQHAGASRASEPETKAMVKFIREIKPDLGIWYHQDLNIISPGTGIDGKLRTRYSQLSGIPLKRITGGIYTGVAATWQRSTLANSYAFVVELGPTLSSAQAAINAKAIFDVAVLLGTLKKK